MRTDRREWKEDRLQYHRRAGTKTVAEEKPQLRRLALVGTSLVCLFECFTILTERNLIFSTTIHVVEFRFRQAPLCKSQQVIYVHDSRERQLSFHMVNSIVSNILPNALKLFRCRLGSSSVFGLWLSVDLGDQNPMSSWWVICPNLAALGTPGKADAR
jgi:hypothetical protein